MIADLHIHTTASDGALTPQEAAALAAQKGITLMAVTDHDTVDGADELSQAEALPLRVLPGVELNLEDMEGLHLLGYGLPAADSPLRVRLAELRAAREARMDRMVEKVHALGMNVDASPLKKLHGSVGRPHLAILMAEQGFAADKNEAFARYLAEGRPAYVAAERMNMRQALTLMTREGMLPVLAHPARLNVEEQRLPVLLEKWTKIGLAGVEVYHPAQRSRGFASLDAMTRRMGLLVTGGSDFHAANTSGHGMIGETARLWPRMEEDVNALLAACARIQ